MMLRTLLLLSVLVVFVPLTSYATQFLALPSGTLSHTGASPIVPRAFALGVDSSTHGSGFGSSTSGVLAHGADVLIIAFVMVWQSTSPDCNVAHVTIAGVDLTQVTYAMNTGGISSTDICVSAWSISRSASASETFSISFDASVIYAWSAVGFTGTSITTPHFESVSTSYGYSVDASVPVSAGTAGRTLIEGIGFASTLPTSILLGSGQSQIDMASYTQGGNDAYVETDYKTGQSETTMSATFAQIEYWAAVSVALVPASGPQNPSGISLDANVITQKVRTTHIALDTPITIPFYHKAQELVAVVIMLSASGGYRDNCMIEYVTIGGADATQLAWSQNSESICVSVYYAYEPSAGSDAVTYKFVSIIGTVITAFSIVNVLSFTGTTSSEPFFESVSTTPGEYASYSEYGNAAVVPVSAGTSGRRVVQTISFCSSETSITLATGQSQMSLAHYIVPISSPQTNAWGLETNYKDDASAATMRADFDTPIYEYWTSVAAALLPAAGPQNPSGIALDANLSRLKTQTIYLPFVTPINIPFHHKASELVVVMIAAGMPQDQGDNCAVEYVSVGGSNADLLAYIPAGQAFCHVAYYAYSNQAGNDTVVVKFTTRTNVNTYAIINVLSFTGTASTEPFFEGTTTARDDSATASVSILDGTSGRRVIQSTTFGTYTTRTSLGSGQTQMSLPVYAAGTSCYYVETNYKDTPSATIMNVNFFLPPPNGNPVARGWASIITAIKPAVFIQVTVTTSPVTGSGFVKVDGAPYPTPTTFSWPSGSQHLLEALTPVSCGTGCQRAWSDWSDGGGIAHSYTVLGYAQTVTASYTTRYLLTMSASPPSGGTTTPAIGSYWYAAGTQVVINATDSQGYEFQSWVGSGSDSYTGTIRGSQVTMNSSINETANFAGLVTMTVSYRVTGGGSGYSAPIFSYVQGGTPKQYALTTSPTGIFCDSGSDWSVAPNPLSPSGSSERWQSPQALNGAASTQGLVFSFQHQYMLMMQSNPVSGGTTLPDSGWQDAGAAISISADANMGYTFQSWAGSGQSSYTGTSNPASITMSAPITETANFYQGQAGSAMLTVSYTVVGGGSPEAPIFSYMQDGQSRQYLLTQTPTGISADASSTWAVTLNPLVGSNNMERWYSTQALSGTASAQVVVFSYQHQYYLTMQGSSYYGSVSPESGWQNSGTLVQITVTPQSGQTFQAWAGSGTGSYTGSNNPASITMNSPITEIANFAAGEQPPTGACKFVGGGKTLLGGGVYEHANAGVVQSVQLPFIILGMTGPGAFINRRGLRWLRRREGHRGGISKLVASLILIVFVAAGIAGISLYYSTIAGGAVSHQDVDTMGSIIKVNTADDSGSVYLKIHNTGMGTVSVSAITVSGHLVFAVNFTDAVGSVPSGWTCLVEGSQGVGIIGTSPHGHLVIPSGATVSILATTSSGMASYFTLGIMCAAWITLQEGPALPFTVPSESSP